MYTVGQVAKFLGISRDTLKFYEEKNLINPIQDKENGYRKYNIIDINEIITINFYRDIDIEIKKIQEIRKNESISTIEDILDEKERNLREEIEYKTLLIERIRDIKEHCKYINESLNKFTIREMKPIVITNEITVSGELQETYSQILDNYDSSLRLKKAVNLSGLSRIVYFDEKTIQKERYVFYDKCKDNSKEKQEVHSYSKCIYTVIGIPILSVENNIDENMAELITETSRQMGYETQGIAFINLMFNGYKDGQNIQYLEIYTPVK